MRATALLTAVLCMGCLAVLSAGASSARAARAGLQAALDADELERATIAKHLGDEALLSALRQRADVSLRLAAVRCSPYLSDPDRALPVLAEIASGRDPELAPGAALRLSRIAQQLVRAAPLHELAIDRVSDARRRLLALAEDRGAPQQLRVHAGQAGFLLDQLLRRAQAALSSG